VTNYINNKPFRVTFEELKLVMLNLQDAEDLLLSNYICLKKASDKCQSRGWIWYCQGLAGGKIAF
jgi:hypothetical protein